MTFLEVRNLGGQLDHELGPLLDAKTTKIELVTSNDASVSTQ